MVQTIDQRFSNLVITEPSAGRCEPGAFAPMPVTSPGFRDPNDGWAGA